MAKTAKPTKTPKVKKKAIAATKLPMPASIPVQAVVVAPPKAVLRAERAALVPLRHAVNGTADANASIMERLERTVRARQATGNVGLSHSARLLSRGSAKVAQKLGEEAVELVIEATLGNRRAAVLESADLLYHLVVLWVDQGIKPEEVWGELVRREGISGIAEKAARPKGIVRAAKTTKLP
ncbi:phosphoribosyl-ATP diphosphatase [Humitalea sp. 24SJ18S-53]|uniref:phosphoribosyl-ATP diphosphatase n=1 Tax=Humitalea sp. 24SJ18S-53 TaxID=3422307 RepID=UPI003D66B52C